MEFDTAVARVTEDEDEAPSIEFFINERDPETEEILERVPCRAYKPADGEVSVLLADTGGRRADNASIISGLIDFVLGVVDEDTKRYMTKRLLDRSDPFGAEDLLPIAHELIAEWSGRPTKQPSDFARSRKSGGPSSTRRTSKSTSSPSRRTAS